MMLNWVGIIVLATLILNQVLELIADSLNLKALKTEIPSEFSDVYDAEKYTTSQEYLKVGTRFGWISSSVSLIGFLSFWFLGGFEIINNWAIGFDLGFIPSGLLFLGALSGLSSILSLPFSLYRTFVIEERFGFNRTTWKTWLLDGIKGLSLTLVLGVPLISLILWMLEMLGDWAWLYAWIAMQVFSLIIQFIAPTWIMPLFNKFTPLEDGTLRTAIMNFADKVSFNLQNIFVIDGSKRSSKSNAFFTGFGKNKRIALYDTLVNNHTEPELVAVLAHEIGHYKHKHILKSMILSTIQSFVIFWLFGLFMREQALYDAFYMSSTPIYAGLLFFSMILSPVDMLLSLFTNVRSRKHEFEADAFAVVHTNERQPMIDALKKLSRDNLSNLTPHPFYVYLHYSHPPVLERIRAIRKIDLTT
ncbi:M48 family peptidase [bacterium]|nr:MAG: M48 family peptidase [bacterium]